MFFELFETESTDSKFLSVFLDFLGKIEFADAKIEHFFFGEFDPGSG